MKVKNRTQAVFRELLIKADVRYSTLDGVSMAAAYRLYHGKGRLSAKVIDKVAKVFGKAGNCLIKAWLEDLAAELPTKRTVTVVVE